MAPASLAPARAAVRLVVVLVLTASLSAVTSVAAQAITRPQTLYHERPVGTGVVAPGFPIDHVGVVFELAPGEDAAHAHGADETHDGTERLSIRLRTDGRWGPWQQVIEDGAQAVGQWTGALVAGDDADAYQVRGVPSFARNARAVALNTTDGPQRVVGHRPVGSAAAVTTCRSRADWGADERLRTADRSYAPLQVMTVHHTATQNDDPDPDARVRAIYTYHTQTNGWDDIGYQALISEDGTVYEGRWSGSDSPSCLTDGGTGWGFGHTGTTGDTDVVTGAHTGGHNTGNFGVALLGTLTDVAPKAAARDALVEYLAELADRHGIDPQATVRYDNGVNAADVPTIGGHRDYTATECPGGGLYDDLPAVRSEVAARLTPSDPDPSPSPSTTDAVAIGELTSTGSVAGTYHDTATVDGVVEVLSEVESGGKPSRRTSELEHRWTFEVAPGDAVTLLVDASASSSADGDGFAFDYAVDGGTYRPALVVPAGAAGTFSAALAPDTAGTVHVRVVDTDRTAGARALDRLYVDRIVVRTGPATASTPTSGEPDPTEPTETAIELTTTGTKVRGQHEVVLGWTGADRVRVLRDGSAVADVTGAGWTDATGAKGTAAYRHQVCELDGAGALTGRCSDVVTTSFG